jgi:hypothetical protein
MDVTPEMSTPIIIWYTEVYIFPVPAAEGHWRALEGSKE